MTDISLDDFTAAATTFLDANADRRSEEKFVWGEGSDRVGMLDEKTPEQEARELAAAKAWKAEGVRRRLRLDHRPDEYGGAALPTDYDRALPRDRRSLRDPVAEPVRHRARHGRADDPRPRDPRGARALPAVDVARRHRRVPAVLRADRRLRPRRDPDQGRARRRRVDRHRPEGVDLRRAVLRHRRDHHPHVTGQAQAQGPDDVPRRHARPGDRGAAAAPDDRRRVVQRGVLRRGARARLAPARRRRRRLDRRAHHADERAGRIGGGGAGVRHDEHHPLLRDGPALRASTTTRSCARASPTCTSA